MKKVAVLGATGSIGTSTLEVIRAHSDRFKIVLASSHNNKGELIRIATEFQIPEIVITKENHSYSREVVSSLTNLQYGEDSLISLLANIECDLIVNAISGSAGLKYTIEAIESGRVLALANKESLVMAGSIIKEKIKKNSARIIPIDSEHSAIFQALGDTPVSQLRSIIITASGGPFLNFSKSQLNNVTREDALAHPTWEMGEKITIDSATMMNKGLEVIEAHWLFDLPYEKIQAVIHPQSIIHSLIEFLDGSILAQLSKPDMKLPILFALTYPQHINSNICLTDLTSLPQITFKKIPQDRYPLFFLTIEAAKKGGLYPAIVNSANEAAVKLFLTRKIGFTQIYQLVDKVIQQLENVSHPDLELVLHKNQEVFDFTTNNYQKLISV